MKRIIIRSMSVALVLAILCTSAGLMIFKSYWFIILLFATLFLLDASDSMLAYRLKRIEDPQMRSSFIYVYLGFHLIEARIFGNVDEDVVLVHIEVFSYFLFSFS